MLLNKFNTTGCRGTILCPNSFSYEDFANIGSGAEGSRTGSGKVPGQVPGRFPGRFREGAGAGSGAGSVECFGGSLPDRFRSRCRGRF